MTTEQSPEEKALATYAILKNAAIQVLRKDPAKSHTANKDGDVYSAVDLSEKYLGDKDLLNSAVDELFISKLTEICRISDDAKRNEKFQELRSLMPLKAVSGFGDATICITKTLLGELVEKMGLTRIEDALDGAIRSTELAIEKEQDRTRINSLFVSDVLADLKEYAKDNKMSEVQAELLFLKYQFFVQDPVKILYYSKATLQGDDIVRPLFEKQEHSKREFVSLHGQGWRSRDEIRTEMLEMDPPIKVNVSTISGRAVDIAKRAIADNPDLIEENFSRELINPKTQQTIRLFSTLCKDGDEYRGIDSIVNYSKAKPPKATAAAAVPSDSAKKQKTSAEKA